MRIAIIGGGLSGANTLKALLSHPNFSAADAVDIYEPREFIGPGFPYQIKEDHSIKLNTAPEAISQDQNNPDDFIEWLDQNNEAPNNFEQLVARSQYGTYLIEHFKRYVQHPQVQHLRETVEDLEIIASEDGGNDPFVYRLKTNKGWQAPIYDAVFLCVGHPPYNDFYHLQGMKNYIHNPYPMLEKLAHLQRKQKIAIIGSGATGVDVMRYIMTHYKLNSPLSFFDIKEPIDPITIPFEKGTAYMSISKEWIKEEKEKHGGFIPLQLIAQKIKDDLSKENVDILSVYKRYGSNDLAANRDAFEAHDQELAVAQKYSSQLVPLMPALYNALTLDDRKEYMENYRSLMLFFKTRVPHSTYKWIFELVDSGKLVGHSDLEDIEMLPNGKFKMLMQSGSYEADVVVNATGFDVNLENVRKHSPLIDNLSNRRIILPQDNGKYVLVDWPETRVVNQRYGVMDNLFFQGALIAGTQHENNDIGVISDHALYVAKSFMDKQNRKDA